MADRPEMTDTLNINHTISVPVDELEFSFVRSSGPGGQNVNKVATAVQLRFDLMGSPSLPEPLKARAARLAGSRLTNDGVIVIFATGTRSQALNRQQATERLADLLRAAAIVPKQRRKTKPTLASKRRRLDAKTKRGATKSLRGRVPPSD